MPGQEKMVMDFYQKNQSAVASLRGTVYEEKIIKLIKEKAKSNKKTISKEEAEKILKESQNQIHNHDNLNKNKEVKTSSKKAEDKKTSSKKTKSKSIKTKPIVKKSKNPASQFIHRPKITIDKILPIKPNANASDGSIFPFGIGRFLVLSIIESTSLSYH